MPDGTLSRRDITSASGLRPQQRRTGWARAAYECAQAHEICDVAKHVHRNFRCANPGRVDPTQLTPGDARALYCNLAMASTTYLMRSIMKNKTYWHGTGPLKWRGTPANSRASAKRSYIKRTAHASLSTPEHGEGSQMRDLLEHSGPLRQPSRNSLRELLVVLRNWRGWEDGECVARRRTATIGQ